MKYAKIVQYVKENHISWDTDIFDILKDYTEGLRPPVENKEYEETNSVLSHTIKGQNTADTISSPLLEVKSHYQIPANGEYSFEDVIELFSR
jgi:hypothetical protein